ncbi:hypothetical protein [Chryseobacterium carnipullorum]|uniref:hypothetical protein n=1 Tax=Chryseobacterium carnipullorum TaxID=1124835 RepID=UPI000F4FE941|nr:hypothetical protein [Chryseobacterium carnipullorum]
MYFPEARSVILEGGDGMQSISSTASKDKNGFWNISTSPLETGFHYYWLNVDGKRTNDPNTQLYFGYGQPTSGIEVSSGEDFFMQKSVKHGTIVDDSLDSKITQGKRNFKVYLPPNYGSKSSRFYICITEPEKILRDGKNRDISGIFLITFLQKKKRRK